MPGSSRRVWLAAIGALIVVVVAVAAVVFVAPKLRGGSDVSSVDAAELLQRSATRMDGVKSLRFVLEHENGAAEIFNGLLMRRAEGAVAGPNRLSVDVDAQAGPLNAKVSFIVLPDQSWVTNPLTGRWEKQDVRVAQLFDPTQGVTGLMRNVKNPHVTGQQTINGKAVYVVEATIDSGSLSLFASGAPSGKQLPAKAWIGVDDPLVYRIEVDGGVTSSEPPNLVRRLNLSDFGATIDIQPPR